MTAAVLLASASPRRRELLAQLGIRFTVVPSAVPEIPEPGEAAEACARRLARAKAAQVARQHPDCLVLGADTVVVVDDALLGKPADREEARRMLRRLSGRTHRVLTAVALIVPPGGVDEVLAESRVEFRPLTAAEINAYVDGGEPFDKAGAYAIQGGARAFVRRVDGSLSNVIGLPVDEVAALLHRHLQASTTPPA
jgi:nucleoside triphosphate pyrophosphatase